MVISSVSSSSQKSLASDMVRDEWDTRLVDEGPISERRLRRVSDPAAVPLDSDDTTAKEKEMQRAKKGEYREPNNSYTRFQHTQRKRSEKE